MNPVEKLNWKILPPGHSILAILPVDDTVTIGS
jgi:hypothetical protein